MEVLFVRQPLAKTNRVVPADERHRVVVAGRVAVAPAIATVAGIETFVLRVGDFEGAQVERLRDGHIARRLLVEVAVREIAFAGEDLRVEPLALESHAETPGLDAYQLHVDGIDV